jgi:hypothetical protein
MFEQFADKVGEAAAKDPNAYIDMLKRQLDPGEAGATALNVVAPVLSEMPMVKGLNDVMEVVNSKDKGGSKVNRFMAMQAGSMVPMSSWFNELGAATDKSQRETGADTTSQAMIRGVMSKIPVVRERLAPRVDVLGRPLESSPMDPFRSQTDKSKDPVISELKRLDITLTQPDFVREESMSDLKKRVLRDYDDAAQQPGQSDSDYIKALAAAGVIRATRSRDEQHLIQQLAGRMLDKELTAAVNSDGYRQAADEDRTKGLNSVIRDFRADLNGYLKSGEYQSMTKENRLAKLKEMLAGLDVKGQVK